MNGLHGLTDEQEFIPTYERWRHGGWYVTNCRYPNGAVGCVSNNYVDKKWRVVTGPYHVTFPSREAAAKAEYLVVMTLKQSREATEKGQVLEYLRSS